MNASAGISAAARYLPWFRLTAEEIARTQRRSAPEKAAERRLAGYDEDALTMAVAAARLLPVQTLTGVERLLFATTTPPYLAKNNASAAHAALGLPEAVPAFDVGGSLRSAFGAIQNATAGSLLLAGDVNTARPGAAAELGHGDAAAALLFGRPGTASRCCSTPRRSPTSCSTTGGCHRSLRSGPPRTASPRHVCCRPWTGCWPGCRWRRSSTSS